MICKKCGAKNKDTREKCFNCGSFLATPQKFTPETREEKYEDYPDDTKNFQDDGPIFDDISPSKRIIDKKTDTDNVLFPDMQNIVVEPVIRTEPFKEPSNNVKAEDTQGDSYLDNNLYFNTDDDDSFYDKEFENEETNYEDNTEDPKESDAVYDDELSDEDYEILKEIQAEKQLEEKQKKIRSLEIDESAEQHFKSASNSKHSGIGFLIWILILLFIIVSLFMGILIYNYLNSDDDNPVDPSLDTTLDLGIPTPVVTKMVDADGKEYLHAVFTGTPGDRIYLACNNSYHTFVENELQIDLYLEDLFSSEYEFRSETVEANMHAYYVRESKKYSCQSPYVKMTIPYAEVDLSSLPTQNIKVFNDTYLLKFWTDTNSKVELNGEDITSSMTGTGSFNYEIKVPENSSTTYYLTVSQPHHLSKTEVFMLTRDFLPVALTISTNEEESQSDSQIKLRCQTEENTTITANLPILSMEWNDLYSTADITLDLSSCKYGEIEAIITATNSKGSSTKSHTFIYWPDETSITTQSNKFTSAVATNPASYQNINYVINSVKATKNTSANRFEGVANLNGVDYKVIFDITDVSSNVIIGNSYKIFAQCTGTYENNMPLFRVWFIYKG